VKQPPTTHIKLKTRLLPVLIGVLLLMQLTFPYKGWTILLVGLGSLWLVSYLWARALAQSLNLSREMRFGWAHVGDHLEERFTLTNAGPVPSLWAEIVDHSTLPGYSANRVTGVDRNGRNRWYTQGVCRRRGIFTLGPTTIRTGDPFGLYTISVHCPESAPLTITPPIVPLPMIEVAPGGRAGEGRSRPDIFERTVSTTGVRNYVSGDSLKSIHWPTTARQGSLYVRLFDSTPSGDWWIFLDLDDQIQAGQDDTSTEEHAIILAASLADRGLRLGRAVGLAAHGQELTWLPPQAADFQRQNILRALALANPGSCSLGQLLTQTRPALGHFSSLIIITVATEIHNWIEALPPLLQRGAIATVLLLDPASFGGTSEAAGAGALLTNLGVTSFVITRDVLDQPEARPGLKGHWQWRVSPSGRAVAINRPEDMAWKSLR
jgi:uncharacterized protein (DUF58 family)